MNLSPPSDRTLSIVLVAVCSLGAVINGTMLGVSLRRRFKIKQIDNPIAGRIAQLTLKRATRVELGFLVCQLARLAHTLWFFHDPKSVLGDRPQWVFFFAVVERSFVTIMLVYLSVWDLWDRKRIARLLTVARVEDIGSTGLTNLLGDVPRKTHEKINPHN